MIKEINQYAFKDSSNLSNVGIKASTNYLKKHPNFVAIKNVEYDPRFQKLDVDLLFAYKQNNEILMKKIEVKTDDKTLKTKNYFLETISNKNKQTKGCFLISEADYFFYVLTKKNLPLELHIIPLKIAQRWFALNSKNYKDLEVFTPVNNSGYTTVGKAVPIKDLAKGIQQLSKGKVSIKKIKF